MDQFQHLIPIISEAMGASGPRNYLIEQVNPAELRTGGGFIGSYSLLQANPGALKLLPSGDSYDITNPRTMLGQKVMSLLQILHATWSPPRVGDLSIRMFPRLSV